MDSISLPLLPLSLLGILIGVSEIRYCDFWLYIHMYRTFLIANFDHPFLSLFFAVWIRKNRVACRVDCYSSSSSTQILRCVYCYTIVL